MNKKRLLILADWLDAGAPHKHVEFNMGKWLLLVNQYGLTTDYVAYACGSVCCIAGAAAQFFAPRELMSVAIEDGCLMYPGRVYGIAQRALDIDEEQARLLFAPITQDRRRCLRDITPQEAGKVIRRLVKTGKVDWQACLTGVVP